MIPYLISIDLGCTLGTRLVRLTAKSAPAVTPCATQRLVLYSGKYLGRTQSPFSVLLRHFSNTRVSPSSRRLLCRRAPRHKHNFLNVRSDGLTPHLVFVPTKSPPSLLQSFCLIFTLVSVGLYPSIPDRPTSISMTYKTADYLSTLLGTSISR